MTTPHHDNSNATHATAAESKIPILLYNPDSTLEIRRDIADGFLILLSGGLNSAAAIKSRSFTLHRDPIRTATHLDSSTDVVGPSPGAPSSTSTAAAAAGGESTSQVSSSHHHSSITPSELSALQLAFAALTDGNVIEAVFGAHCTGGMIKSKDTSLQAYNDARAAKRALIEVSEQVHNEAFFKLAVSTYCQCFEIVITYRMHVEEMNTFTWCLKHQKARADAEAALEKVFSPLYQEVSFFMSSSSSKFIASSSRLSPREDVSSSQ